MEDGVIAFALAGAARYGSQDGVGLIGIERFGVLVGYVWRSENRFNRVEAAKAGADGVPVEG